MAADISKYLGLITSEHREAPKFNATVAAIAQPLAELRDMLAGLPRKFDLDVAVGRQLDFVGQWIGLSRRVTVPIAGDFFSWDTADLGWDQGVWFSIGDILSGIELLPDEAYRLLLKAKALNNAWDGSIPRAYAIWDTLLAGLGYTIIIIDNGDLTMDLGFVGTTPDALTLALFVGGYLDLKPAGVRIAAYLLQPVAGPPFAFDAPPPAAFAGLDAGVWTDVITP